MVNDWPNEKHKVLGIVSQILVDAEVCDGSNLASCENWGMHIRVGICI